MPGKHGMTKYKKGMPKYKKGMPKLSEKQAKHIDTNKDGEISGADFPINKGIGNYKGSGNFAMKNKVLAKSAKYGEPMQKNFLGKVGKAMMGPAGMLLTKKPLEAQAKSQIVDSKVSGAKQVANLTKHKPENSETNKDYQRALNLAKQREQSEKEDKKKA